MPYKLGISSMSLGRYYAGHDLAHKLDMAQKYGFQGLELFHEDMVGLIKQFSPSTTEPSVAQQIEAAELLRGMCAERGIEIICLQPFAHYEGLLDRKEHERRLDELRFWIRLAHILKTDMIQIPSSFLPADQVSDDLDLIVSDLQKVADIGLAAEPPIRFVYESLAWGTRVDTWERCWEVVTRVDRPNFGICLDSFNIAGRIYADPTSPTGCTPDAEEAVRRSMARMMELVEVRKLFYVQVVDAERLEQPLVEGHAFHNPEQPARMSWSRNCRLFYGEKDRGAYLPVEEILAVFFHGLGFEGWVSMELFNRRMADEDPGVPEELARRGAVSWAKLVHDMNLAPDPASTRPCPRIAASL